MWNKKKRKTPKTENEKCLTRCDKLWSKIIRLRDPLCRWCRVQPSHDAHHIVSRTVKYMRHMLINGIGLCIGCHSKAEIMPADFREWFVRKFSVESWEHLNYKLRNILKKPDYSMRELELKHYKEHPEDVPDVGGL